MPLHQHWILREVAQELARQFSQNNVLHLAGKLTWARHRS